MELLTFSQFAKILYHCCGNGETTSEFVKTLTNNIMKGRPANPSKDGYVNPMLNKSDRSLQNYFNGTRPIPKRDAIKILGRIDKYKFEQYFEAFSDGALSLVANELNNLIPNMNVNSTNVVAKCADIYEEILQELAKRCINESNKK